MRYLNTSLVWSTAILLSLLCALHAGFVDQTATLITDSSTLGDGPSSWGDYNRDGYPDLNMSSGLWRNEGGTNFTRIAGYGPGPWGDYDNDGYLDLFRYYNPCRIWRYVPQSDTFELADQPQIATPHSALGAVWADFNGDTYLDLYVGGYETWPTDYWPDTILSNTTAGVVTQVWEQTGDIDPARGITACDFDEDGDVDVYVSNYRLEANLLWQNDGGMHFVNVAPAYGVDGDYNGYSWSYGHTIGSAWGDLDNDGHFDLFVGNFSHPDADQDRPKFYRNMGPSGSYHFQDKSSTAGLAWQESYASPALGDYDNDGDLDLYFTTVYGGDYPVLYRNNGNWTFSNVTAAQGLGGLGSTYQAAWADFDNDGDLDLVTDGKLFVNQGNANHWLELRLEGDRLLMNRTAIGAQARIQVNGQTLTRQVEAGTGQGNQNDLTLHFGLGSWADPVDVALVWPDGTTQTLENVAVDQILVHRIDSNPLTLEVVSPYGTPSPPVGIHTNGYQMYVTAGVTSPDIRGSTQYMCTGWTLAGNTPTSGNTNWLGMVQTNDAVLTWNWTSQYFLSTAAEAGGTVASGGWYDPGASVSVTATPSYHYAFAGWSGDVPAAHTNDNPLSLDIDQALSVTARFSQVSVTHYADHGAVNPPVWPYLGWATAATSIQDAVNAAWNGDEVLVKPDTYDLETQLSVTNGARVRSEGGPTNTILKGRSLDRCAHLAHPGAVLEGFTITGGEQNSGGGVFCEGGTLQYCVVTGNQASAYGGGVYLKDGGIARNCIISRNHSSQYGGGAVAVYDSTILNCLVTDNTADISGGGIGCAWDGVVQNCTVVDNEAGTSGGGLYGSLSGTILNTIAYANDAPGGTNWTGLGGGIVYAYCCSEPLMPGVGNLATDPQLTDNGDYRLQRFSPCIDTGTNLTAEGVTNDLAGAPRPLDGTDDGTNAFDIGAYEFVLGDVMLALQVISTYGTSSPSVGIHSNGYGTILTNTVISPDTHGSTQYVCTGWTLAGNSWTDGDTNWVAMRQTNGAVLTWNWSTQYFLDVTVETGGSVDAGGWYARGATVDVTATPTYHYAFTGWTGDVPPSAENDNPLSLDLDQPLSVVAGFDPIDHMSFYVDVATTNPPVWPYLTWATAATGIQEAVDVAWSGDRVLVNPGTYDLASHLSVTNGVWIRSTDGATNSILKGRSLDRCVHLAHPDAVLEGFTITGGKHDSGGGVFCEAGAVQRCIVTGNQAATYGGGVYLSPGGIVRNCLICNNLSSRYGGGVIAYSGGTVHNTTIAGNTADSSGGGLFCALGGTVQNTIVYSNTAPAGANWGALGGGISYAYCCADPLMPGEGNVATNPLLIHSGPDSGRLLPASPCIDTGTNLVVQGVTNDLAAVPRPLDGTDDGTNGFDIGAYEFVNSSADTDDDGMRDIEEIAAGTDPCNPASLFGIEWIGSATPPDSTGMVIRWRSAANKRYRLERSTNLMASPPFNHAVASNIPAAPPMNTETDRTATGNVPVFYRIKLEP